MKDNLWINDDSLNILPSIEDNSVQLVFTGIPDSNDLGFDDFPDQYEEFVDQCLYQFTRITKDDGFIGMCQTDRKMKGEVSSKHSMLIYKMKELGYKLKDYKIVLKKLMPSPYKDQFYFPYFHFCIFTRKGTIKRTGKWMRNVMDYKMEKKNSYYVFPYDFVALVIEFLSKKDDLVIDPFAGTGIIPYVAKEMKRKFIGIEIDDNTYEFSMMNEG